MLEGDGEPLGEGPDWNAERRGEEGIVAYGMAGGGLVRRARAKSVDAYVNAYTPLTKFYTRIYACVMRHPIKTREHLAIYCSNFNLLIFGIGARTVVLQITIQAMLLPPHVSG